MLLLLLTLFLYFFSSVSLSFSIQSLPFCTILNGGLVLGVGLLFLFLAETKEGVH